MEHVLSFFSDLILFSAGLVVATLWLIIIFVVIDEIIDLVINHRNNKEES